MKTSLDLLKKIAHKLDQSKAPSHVINGEKYWRISLPVQIAEKIAQK
jgi:hypothetical protein